MKAALRFACGQQAVAGPVRDVVRQFRQQHPQARVRISTVRGPQRIEGVANGVLDLALVEQLRVPTPAGGACTVHATRTRDENADGIIDHHDLVRRIGRRRTSPIGGPRQG